MTEILKLIETKHANDSGIIFCNTCQICDDYSQYLHNHGIKAKSYHSNVKSSEREKVQKEWCYDGKVNCKN